MGRNEAASGAFAQAAVAGHHDADVVAGGAEGGRERTGNVGEPTGLDPGIDFCGDEENFHPATLRYA